jgi:septal ring factor EnvC (AmiA/AmiB activator)
MLFRQKEDKEDISESLRKVLQNFFFSTESDKSLQCPLAKKYKDERIDAENRAQAANAAYNKMKMENDKLIGERNDLKLKISDLSTQITQLSTDRTKLSEELNKLRTQLDSTTSNLKETTKANEDKKAILDKYNNVLEKTKEQLPQLDLLLQQFKDYEQSGVYGKYTTALIKNIRTSIEKIKEFDDIRLSGALPTLLDLGKHVSTTLSSVPKIRADSLRETEKSVESVRSLIRSNDSCDFRIPSHFLSVCDVLLDKAQDHTKENAQDTAQGEEQACIEIVNAIKTLYQDPTYRLQLSILREH